MFNISLQGFLLCIQTVSPVRDPLAPHQSQRPPSRPNIYTVPHSSSHQLERKISPPAHFFHQGKTLVSILPHQHSVAFTPRDKRSTGTPPHNQIVWTKGRYSTVSHPFFQHVGHYAHERRTIKLSKSFPLHPSPPSLYTINVPSGELISSRDLWAKNSRCRRGKMKHRKAGMRMDYLLSQPSPARQMAHVQLNTLNDSSLTISGQSVQVLEIIAIEQQ